MKPSRRGGAIAAAVAVVLVAAVAVMLVTRHLTPQPPGTANNAACQSRLTWAAGEDGVSLFGTAAVSRRDAWAVGARQGHAAILHWDGDAWSDAALSPQAAAGTASTALLDVAAVDARDVWAVGRAGQTSLILHWDGTAWTSVAAAPVGAYRSQLSALAVVAPDDVWAIGSALRTQQGTPYAIAAHWGGQAWGAAPAPGPSVAALAASTAGVWALVSAADNTQQVVRWDGQAWRALPAPDPAAKGLNLSAIAAGPGGVLWAAGSYWPPEENWAQPIAERWDGQAWTPYPSALEARGARYVSLAVGRDGTAWAAGIFTNFNTRLNNVFLRHLGGRNVDTTMSIYPNSSANLHRDGAFNVSQIALAPSTDIAWVVGSTGSAPDPSLPPIDSNLPKGTGAFVLQYC